MFVSGFWVTGLPRSTQIILSSGSRVSSMSRPRRAVEIDTRTMPSGRSGGKAATGSRTGSLSDEQLMARLKDGEMEMLGELYSRYGGLVRAAITRAAPEISLAELDELTQDVFIAIGDSSSRYDERNKLKGWVYGISSRKARLWRRNTWPANGRP